MTSDEEVYDRILDAIRDSESIYPAAVEDGPIGHARFVPGSDTANRDRVADGEWELQSIYVEPAPPWSNVASTTSPGASMA